MNRKLWLLSFLLFTSFNLAEAQQPKKVPRIGYLSGGSSSSNAARMDAFRQELRDLGYIEAKNLLIDYHYADGRFDQLPALAAEVVRANVDVILTQGSTATIPAKEATKTIPIVFINVDDPVGSGFVASLARPGGNMTGLTRMALDLSGKRLELLKEAFSRFTRVAVLVNPSPGSASRLKEIKAASQVFGLELQSFEVSDPKEFDSAFSAMTRWHAGALVVDANPMFGVHQKRIAELAARNHLPAIYGDIVYVEAGGLMSYGPDIGDMFRRAATYVHKIIKGAKSADLPVEQPKKFEFIINLKAAKQIGLTIPPNVLVRADKVIK